ncbi:hypothetical protein ACFLRC_04240 [Candidatus Altiarchaeota archaeon]
MSPSSGLKKINLLEDEKVFKRIHPHPFSFYQLFLVWVYVIVISGLFYVYADALALYFQPQVDTVSDFMTPLQDVGDPELLDRVGLFEKLDEIQSDAYGMFGIFENEYVPLVLWIICLFIPSLALSVIRIAWKWILLITGIGILSSLITIGIGADPKLAYILGITFAVLGIVGVELYRRAHSFYVTNFRVITELDFVGYKKNELRYDDIQNLILHQGLIGKVFNFGTLIPITASGLGMGSDMAAVTIGGATGVGQSGMIGGAVTGGRSVDVPRSRSSYMLFGIPNPQETYNVITKMMHHADEAPYLRKMTTGIEELVQQNRDLMEKIQKGGGQAPKPTQKPRLNDSAVYKGESGGEMTTTYKVDESSSEQDLIDENRRLLEELKQQEKNRKRKK